MVRTESNNKKSSTFTVSYTTARKPWLKRKTFFSNANKWRQKCIHFIETLRHWVRVWLFWYVLANTCRDGNASLTLDAREFWFAEIYIALFLFDWLNSWRLSFPPQIQKWSFPSLPFFFCSALFLLIANLPALRHFARGFDGLAKKATIAGRGEIQSLEGSRVALLSVWPDSSGSSGSGDGGEVVHFISTIFFALVKCWSGMRESAWKMVRILLFFCVFIWTLVKYSTNSSAQVK